MREILEWLSAFQEEFASMELVKISYEDEKDITSEIRFFFFLILRPMNNVRNQI
jgi:hypothetical protein